MQKMWILQKNNPLKMIREIYTRNEQDPYYDSEILEHNNDIESILSQIRIILGTSKGQVLGDYNFGVGIEDLIFTTKFNKKRLEDIINQHISDYIKDFPNYIITPNISFFKLPDGTDGGLIDIYINKTKVQGFLIS